MASTRSTPAPPPASAPAPAPAAGTALGARLAAGALGVVLVLGQLLGGGYDVSRWGVAAVVAAVVAIALVVALPWRPAGPGLLVLGSLTALGLLAWASGLWAESRSSTVVEAERWALYALVAAVGLWGLRAPGARTAFLVGVGLASTGVVLVMTLQIATGSGIGLFFVRRLTRPLDYVNGQAAALVTALWPLAAVADRWRRPARSGTAAAGATLALGLVWLTQSRGALLALILSALVVLALVPGRLRRAWLLALLGGAVAAISPRLDAVYQSRGTRPDLPTEASLTSAGLWLLGAALVVGLVWGAATWLVASRDARGRESLRRGAQGALAAGVLAGVVLGLVAVGNPVDRVRTQWDQFTTLSRGVSEQTRLLAGTSNRSDYWRVALEELGEAPVGGLGAGNYTPRYFQLRRTDEDILQPHSLVLQELAELGVLGGLATLGLLAGLVWACVAAGRRVAAGEADAVGVTAAIGIAIAWAAQTSIDWLHLLPSVSAIAILAATTLVGGRPARATGRGRLPLTVVAILLAVVSAGGAVRLVLAERALDRAQEVLPRDPSVAVQQAERSLSLHGQQLDALFVEAAAFARIDDYDRARATLERAAALEPRNFLPPALLGDLAVRRGDERLARLAYRLAYKLNPRSAVLRDDLAGVGVRVPAPRP